MHASSTKLHRHDDVYTKAPSLLDFSRFMPKLSVSLRLGRSPLGRGGLFNYLELGLCCFYCKCVGELSPPKKRPTIRVTRQARAEPPRKNYAQRATMSSENAPGRNIYIRGGLAFLLSTSKREKNRPRTKNSTLSPYTKEKSPWSHPYPS